MSKLRFDFKFGMTDGSSKDVQVDVDNVMSTSDPVTDNAIAAPVLGTSETVQLTGETLAARVLGDLFCTVNSGTMMADIRTAGKALFPTLSDKGAIELYAGGTIFINAATVPTADVFTGAVGRFKFAAIGAIGTTAQVTLQVISGTAGSSTTGAGVQLTETTYTLQPGDTLNAEGQVLDGGVYGYYVNVVRALADSNNSAGVAAGSLKASGTLLPVGASLILNIPDIGIQVKATSTGTTTSQVTLVSTTGASITSAYIRRDTMYNASSLESYTGDGVTISATSPLNIDGTVYANSNDTNHVMIAIGGKVWELRYWFCGGNAFGLIFATKMA